MKIINGLVFEVRPYEMQTDNGLQALDGGVVLKVVRVGDLAGSPFTLVGRVVDHGSIPLALVGGVGLVWSEMRF